MQIGLNVDTKRLETTLKGWELQQLPFATAKALTQTGQIVKNSIRGTMQVGFDRPTPYALNSLSLTPATKKNLVAIVQFKTAGSKGTPASRFLAPDVVGGAREAKPFEILERSKSVLPRGMIVVPGSGMKLNQYGNISLQSLEKIIIAATGNGFTKNDAKRSNRNAKPIDIFVGKPAGDRLPLGVYQRTIEGLKPLLIFVDHANYKVRLPFADIARQVYEANFQRLFEAALRDALVLSPNIAGAS